MRISGHNEPPVARPSKNRLEWYKTRGAIALATITSLAIGVTIGIGIGEYKNSDSVAASSSPTPKVPSSVKNLAAQITRELNTGPHREADDVRLDEQILSTGAARLRDGKVVPMPNQLDMSIVLDRNWDANPVVTNGKVTLDIFNRIQFLEANSVPRERLGLSALDPNANLSLIIEYPAAQTYDYIEATLLPKHQSYSSNTG